MMTKEFIKLNNIIGWVVWAIATYTYCSTIEPTASFWDCGEYIACSYKLEVGHPPGAPFFLILGRFFSLLGGGDPAHAAMMVNIMSALSSSFTILFLFWTITRLGIKVYAKKVADLAKPQQWAILGAGIVGALAYTFSDSFWFSAVEGEVYAMSAFFTAVVFWAILKWDEEDSVNPTSALRWLILISYLVGLSIGVAEERCVAARAANPRDVLVRPGDFVRDADERVARRAPRSGRVEFLLQPVVGREDQIKPATDLVNFRCPETVFVRTAFRKCRRFHQPVLERPRFQIA